jgi:cell division protein FtsB
MNNTSILSFPISIRHYLTLKRKFNLKIFWIASFILIIFLLGFYIFQVNNFVFQTYLIKNYQQELKKLSQENENLEINLTQKDSLKTIEDLIKELSFEKVEKIEYIQVVGSTIVAK